MPLSHLKPLTKRIQQLESIVCPQANPPSFSIEEQVQICRSFLSACARGDVERTPEGYRAITDNSTWQQPFEIEPGRWEKRSKIIPEDAERNLKVAEFLTKLFQRTGKYFPVYKGIANQPGPQFVEAVYRHYGGRVFA